MKEEISLPGIPEEYEITITPFHDVSDPAQKHFPLCHKKIKHIPTDLSVMYIMDYSNLKFSKENELLQIRLLKKAIEDYQKGHPKDGPNSFFRLEDELLSNLEMKVL